MSQRLVKVSILVVLLISFFVVTNGVVNAIGVRPLIMELNVRPGDQVEFEMNLTPGEGEELVDLTLYEPSQQLSGGLVYQLPSNPAFSATSWVTLDAHTVRVLPDAESSVKGIVRIPFSARGSHTVIIMVEPRPPAITSGINFQVRYAVRLVIRVERAGVRPSAELTLLEVAPDHQGAPRIRARIKNTSVLDYPVSGEVTIRDQSRRLVERVILQTSAGSSSGASATRVYPGAEVEFAGQITRPLVPGEYLMQTFLRYGDVGQILRNETLVINPGDYEFPGFDDLSVFTVDPVVVEHRLRAGERKSQVFEFESIVGEPIRLELAFTEVKPEYDHSLVEWLELRSQLEFALPARARTRLAMTIAVPRETVDGSYHGNVTFKAYGATSNNLLTETVVPLSVLVGTDHQRILRIRSLEAQTVAEQGTYLSLDLSNSGNVSLRPQVTLVVSNEKGEFIQRVSMVLPEGVNEMLPSQTQHFGLLIPTLEPGDYEVEVTIISDGLEILSEKHHVLVIE